MKIYYFLLMILYQNYSSIDNHSVFRSLDEYLIEYNEPLGKKLKRCLLNCVKLLQGVCCCKWCKKEPAIENRSSFNNISEAEVHVEKHVLRSNNKILTFFFSQKNNF